MVTRFVDVAVEPEKVGLQARRMKDLQRENIRLKRLVADLSLEKQILKNVASGNL
jgi:hypothetical protein